MAAIIIITFAIIMLYLTVKDIRSRQHESALDALNRQCEEEKNLEKEVVRPHRKKSLLDLPEGLTLTYVGRFEDVCFKHSEDGYVASLYCGKEVAVFTEGEWWVLDVYVVLREDFKYYG